MLVQPQAAYSAHTVLFGSFITATICAAQELGDAHSTTRGIVSICRLESTLWLASTASSVWCKYVPKIESRGMYGNGIIGARTYDRIIQLSALWDRRM